MINKNNMNQKITEKSNKENNEKNSEIKVQPLETLDSDFDNPTWKRGFFSREQVDANDNVIKEQEKKDPGSSDD